MNKRSSGRIGFSASFSTRINRVVKITIDAIGIIANILLQGRASVLRVRNKETSAKTCDSTLGVS